MSAFDPKRTSAPRQEWVFGGALLPTRLFGNEAGTLDFVQHKKRCGLYNKLMKIPGTPKMVQPFLAVFTAVGLVVGILAKLTGYDGWASLTWAVVTVVVLIVLLFEN